MTMPAPAAAPAAPATPAPATGARPAPARRRPGEFGGGGRKFTPRRKVCQFCVDKIKEVDYKDLVRLRRFLSERGKIEPRRKTGTCAAHQRSLNVALKRARQLALLPFTAEHIRVTGVLVREPGAPPFRGARPRPPDADGTSEAPAPVDGAVAEASASADGQAAEGAAPAAADGQASQDAASAVSDGQAAEGATSVSAPASAVVAETAAAEAAGEAPLPATQAPPA